MLVSVCQFCRNRWFILWNLFKMDYCQQPVTPRPCPAMPGLCLTLLPLMGADPRPHPWAHIPAWPWFIPREVSDAQGWSCPGAPAALLLVEQAMGTPWPTQGATSAQICSRTDHSYRKKIQNQWLVAAAVGCPSCKPLGLVCRKGWVACSHNMWPVTLRWGKSQPWGNPCPKATSPSPTPVPSLQALLEGLGLSREASVSPTHCLYLYRHRGEPGGPVLGVGAHCLYSEQDQGNVMRFEQPEFYLLVLLLTAFVTSVSIISSGQKI